jgi:FkbH-like protein
VPVAEGPIQELTGQSSTAEFLRAWRQLQEDHGGRRSLRVALTASSTIDTLLPYLGCFLAQRGFAPQFIVAPFNQIYQSLLDPGSVVRAIKADVTIVLPRLEDLCAAAIRQLAMLDPTGIEAARAAAHAEMARLSRALLEFERAEPGPLIVGTLPPPASIPLGLLDASHPASLSHLVRELNLALWHTAREASSLHLLDVETILGRLGTERAWDHRMAYLSGCPLSTAALRSLGEHLSRAVSALFLPSAKVVVVDLDNTLWGGIVGEDGPQGIALAETGLGAAFVAFQDALLALRAQGVLLTVASKNNEADAFEVFDHHPAMRLRRTHLSAYRIGWGPKSESLRELALELSLGLDSFVFVDDSAAECAEVRHMLPEVAVLELPPDPARYVDAIRSIAAFDRMRLTTEDRRRADSYEVERVRAGAQPDAAAGSANPEALREYLTSLELTITVRRLRRHDVSRAAQLTQKTNQFNLTTIRRSDADVESLRRSPDWRLYSVEVTDRFGEYGLTGLAFVDCADPLRPHLETLILSCRVLGRGVESAFFWEVMQDLRSHGADQLTARFIPTAKNVPIREFLPRHGFEPSIDGLSVCSPLPGRAFDVGYVAARFAVDNEP